MKGVTKKELEILKGIKEGLSIIDLSKFRNSSRSSTYKIVRRLIKKGFLEKINPLIELTNQKNNRGFYLTNKGRGVLRIKGIDSIHKKIKHYCEVCGYFLVINKHHIDENRKNNHESNVINLCPNHHNLIHKGIAYLKRIEGNLFYLIKINENIRKLT